MQPFNVYGPFFGPKATQSYKITPRLIRHNFRPGRQFYRPIAIVIHTIVGTLDEAYNHFNNPNSEVSAHYGVGFNGRIEMYVTPSDTAWANGILKPNNKWPGSPNINPNLTTVSIETEGGPTDPVTSQMYGAVKYVCQQSINTFPTIRWLVPHNIISATQCPGTRWTAGKIQQLASELNLKVIV